MIPLLTPRTVDLPRLVLALAAAVPVLLAAVASVPALLVLPFVPSAAGRADDLLDRLARWTEALLRAGPDDRRAEGHRRHRAPAL